MGCVPKKVMYYTASMAEMFHDHADYGFTLTEFPKFDWK